MILSIDLETFSSADITKTGVYKYVESPDFEILLLAYSRDYGPIEIVDLTRGPIPADLANDIFSPSVTKTAYNAAFEIACLSRHFGQPLDVSQWDCTMILAARAGYPFRLANVAAAMGVTKKLESGTALINYFSTPCKPTRANGGRARNLPFHAPEKWEEFKRYCINDVKVENEIRQRIELKKPRGFVSPFENKLWRLDQRINTRGVRVCVRMAENAVNMNGIYGNDLEAEARAISGLENPNSVKQLSDWLGRYGIPAETLRKDDVTELLSRSDLPAHVRRVLEIRQKSSKSSVSKYSAMLNMACRDERVRGLFQFYGANRTGRWSGRGVQLQNLPQNHLQPLDLARQLVKLGRLDVLDATFDDVTDTLSQLIRTALIPADGYRFIISDFSAIEARVIAWLAGESWRMEVFNGHGKIYEASASQMFGIPIEKITKGTPERQKGKVAELALGYQGGVNALISMGALKMGIPQDELPGIVKRWRDANPAIRGLWAAAEEAAIEALLSPGKVLTIHRGVKFQKVGDDLHITLPSGRPLVYVNASIVSSGLGMKTTYYASDAGGKWGVTETYGGKLVENIVQAISRDCLAEALIRVDDGGYNVVMHVHDEIVCEEPIGRGSLDEMNRLMTIRPEWAPDLPLKAEGFEAEYYQKKD